MLNIYIPKEPQLKDYGISEKEIPDIETFVVKPIKKARKREDVLFNYSIIVFAIVCYCALVGVFYYKTGWFIHTKDWDMSIFLFAGILLFFLWFPFPFVFWGSSITKVLLDKLIPSSMLHDRDEEYDERTNKMKSMQTQLSQYKSDYTNWKRTMERTEKDYPQAEKYFPRELKTGTFQYLEFERKYISFYIKEYFIDRFMKEVEHVDNLLIKEREEEEMRHQEEWWKNISDAEFENEVGKWYKDKGYKVKVTQKSGDGGVDIILQKDGETSYVQCKQWKDYVPVSVVRELYGVMSLHNVKKGDIVCLKGGTKGANDFAVECGIRIVTLRDLIKTDYIRPKVSLIKRIYSPLLRQYGEYYISEMGWKDEEEAQTIFRNMKKQFNTNFNTLNLYAFYKCHSFYLRVEGPKEKIMKLPDVDFIMELEKGDITYRKPQPSISSVRPYYPSKRKKHRKGGWYGYHQRW